MRILVLIGTRPEAIKLAPLIRVMSNDHRYQIKTFLTGQHADLDTVLSLFAIQSYASLLEFSRTRSLNELISELIVKLNVQIKRFRPDFVIVQGDTTSALSGALASFNLKVPVVHVEAGLRTYNLDSPFPEEMNRQVISRLARFHFTPTAVSRENLLREGINPKCIFVVGNTVIDSVRLIDEIYVLGENSDTFNIYDKPFILVTLHRRETWGRGMEGLFVMLRRFAKEHREYQIIFVLHPNPVLQKQVRDYLEEIENIDILAPQKYPDFIQLLKQSHLILTDSGGVQEEASYFRKPVLVTRNNTERTEGIESNFGLLVGTEPDLVLGCLTSLLEDEDKLNDMAKGVNPYGDGYAADKISQILINEKK